MPRVDGQGRILSTEILECRPAVRNLVRKNDLQQIYSVIQTNSQAGMMTMNAALLQLFQDGLISLEQALLFTTRQAELEQLVARLPRHDAKSKRSGQLAETR